MKNHGFDFTIMAPAILVFGFISGIGRSLHDFRMSNDPFIVILLRDILVCQSALAMFIIYGVVFNMIFDHFKSKRNQNE